MSNCNSGGCCGGSNSCETKPDQVLSLSKTNFHVPPIQAGDGIKSRSAELTGHIEDREDWVKRSAARAMMRAVGYEDRDFSKPLVAVAAPFTNITPCNGKIYELSQIVSKELENCGAKAFSFGTPVVTDGQAMGMSGMRFSLPSRDLIADCIEMMQEAYTADGSFTLSGCDKTIPGALMPLARNNIFGITLYGGSILPGKYEDEELNIVSTFEAIGKYSSGQMDYEEFLEIEKKACPTCGSCGGMYTANTMASAIEAMGMSLPYSSSNPATTYSGRISEEKYTDCIYSARALIGLMKKEIRPRDIMTKAAFENAVTLVMALSGSTNAVLHLIALAREADIDLGLDDFNRISKRTPIVADMKPSGKYMMYDLFKVGGVPMVLKHLMDMGLIDGSCMTVTGQSVADNLKDAPSLMEYKKQVERNQKAYLNEVKSHWVNELVSGF